MRKSRGVCALCPRRATTEHENLPGWTIAVCALCYRTLHAGLEPRPKTEYIPIRKIPWRRGSNTLDKPLI